MYQPPKWLRGLLDFFRIFFLHTVFWLSFIYLLIFMLTFCSRLSWLILSAVDGAFNTGSAPILDNIWWPCVGLTVAQGHSRSFGWCRNMSFSFSRSLHAPASTAKSRLTCVVGVWVSPEKGDSDSEHVLLLDFKRSIVLRRLGRCTVLAGRASSSVSCHDVTLLQVSNRSTKYRETAHHTISLSHNILESESESHTKIRTPHAASLARKLSNVLNQSCGLEIEQETIRDA